MIRQSQRMRNRDAAKSLDQETCERLFHCSATVVGSELGPKINAMTYKSKSNQRRRWGHRQHYATLEITAITAAG